MIEELVGEKIVSVRLDPALYRRLKAIAKRQRRSLSAQVVLIVDEWLAHQPNEKKHNSDKS
jgi:hypothetical protein